METDGYLCLVAYDLYGRDFAKAPDSAYKEAWSIMRQKFKAELMLERVWTLQSRGNHDRLLVEVVDQFEQYLPQLGVRDVFLLVCRVGRDMRSESYRLVQFRPN